MVWSTYGGGVYLLVYISTCYDHGIEHKLMFGEVWLWWSHSWGCMLLSSNLVSCFRCSDDAFYMWIRLLGLGLSTCLSLMKSIDEWTLPMNSYTNMWSWAWLGVLDFNDEDALSPML